MIGRQDFPRQTWCEFQEKLPWRSQRCAMAPISSMLICPSMATQAIEGWMGRCMTVSIASLARSVMAPD